MTTTRAARAADPAVTEDRVARLRRYNVVMGLVHAAQVVALLLLSNGFTLPVTASYHRPGDGGWLPFVFGCVVGSVPWPAIALYVVSPASSAAATAPGFVYGIVVSLFLLFVVVAANQWLQYARIGRWSATWSASTPTSRSAWWRSRCWPGRSSPTRSSPHPGGPCADPS